MRNKLYTSISLVVFSLCSFLVHAVSNPNFNVAPNGVTCLCPDAAFGETGELTINGVTQTYTKRTRQQLRDLINANQNDPQIALTCTSGITDMNNLFFNKNSFNQDISTWDVSNVTNMSQMFELAFSFNQPLNDWDVSSVSSMLYMFSSAISFNQPLNNWDVSSVTAISGMFSDAFSFNQDISNWCVEQIASAPSNFSINSPLQASFKPNWGASCFYVGDNGVTCFCPQANFGDTGTLTINGVTQTYTKRTRQQLLDLINANQNDPQIALTCTSGITDMNNLFSNKSSFNQDISTWDVSNVTDMSYLFSNASQASSFNQPLNDWDVSSVTNMSNLFYGASSFNQTLSLWDVSNVTDMSFMFSFASSFNQPLNDWNVFNVSNMTNMFNTASSFNQPLNNWDVSNVTNMAGLFFSVSSFNHPLNDWDVSSVTNMGAMFNLASSFNQSLNDWNVSNVTNMSGMFNDASTFNQPLNNWDVSSVTNMSQMFRNASSFNQDISTWCVQQIASEPSFFSFNSPLQGSFKPNWGASCFYVGDNGVTCFCPQANFGDTGTLTINGVTQTYTKRTRQQLRDLINANPNDPQIALTCTSGITDMSTLFSNKSSFNQDISTWDVSNVTNMSYMFWYATSFNQPLNDWDVSNVTNMFYLFNNVPSFNQPLNNWDVSSVTNMNAMFESASSFNQPLNNWDVSSVTLLGSMFSRASSFNQPLNDWDVSSVSFMSRMFLNASAFNQPLDHWDVSSATDISGMFINATSFDQDLGNWDISSISTISSNSMQNMFTGTALSRSNYDNTLIGWSTLDTNETQVPQNVTFSGGNSKYCLSENARTNLINNFNWTITDGGLDTGCSLPALISSTPQANTTNIAFDANLVLTFDAPIIGSLVNANNILIQGNQTGIIPGTFNGGGTNEITFNPTNNFKPGELITVSITAGLAITNPTVFSFTATVSPTSPGEFINGQNVISAAANGARSVFSGDLDGDGDLDILSASENDDKIAWYENDGLGNFGTQKIISTSAGGAFSVYAADIDGDGDLDVLSATFNDNNVIWYENDGNGNFGTPQIISSLVSGVRSIYAADIDGDGDMDVLSASQNDDKIAWYENDGNGNFGTQQVISTLADGALSVFAADIDGDGDLDVLSASFIDNKIAWYENDGTGSFGASQIISTSVNVASSVYAVDIDGDGDLDVLSASFNNNEIAWYENDGNGNFDPPQIISNITEQATNVFAADIDGDGDMDVLSASRSDNKIAWYENDGTGNFSAQQIISASADGAQSVYAVDIDGDGDLDVISASFDNNEIAWYENNLSQTLTATSPIANATNIAFDANVVLTFDAPILGSLVNANNILVHGNQTGIISGTFSGSGTNEINFNPTNNFKPGEVITVSITAGLNITNPTIFSFTTKVSPTSPGEFINGQNVITTDADGARSVFMADLDGDGDLDVLSASNNDDKIAWYENDGLGNFGTQQIITTSADGAFSVYAADIDSDGDLDVLSASFFGNKIDWYENDGTGNFGTQQIISTSLNGVRSVYAMDLDSDGDMDVLSASFFDNRITWHENDGTGNFSSQQIISGIIGATSNGAISVYAADLDGDGDMDVLTASFLEDKIGWHENDGTGNFSTQKFLGILVDGVSSIYAADIDADGDMDVLSASLNDDKIAWFENDGTGNFGTQQIISDLADGATSVYAADIDGDGDLDVISASQNDDKIVWYENDGNGNFGSQQIISNSADGAQSVYAADIDGDGDLDVISASVDNDEIAWYENGAFLRTNWTGNVDEDWENNLNWNKGIPDSEAIATVEDISLNTPMINESTSAETHQLFIGNTGALNVHGVLKVVDKIENNGLITFKSNATKTGQLDEFNGSYSGNGTVEVEQFIPAGDNINGTNLGRAFRFLTSTVTTSSSIRENWQQGGLNLGDSAYQAGFGTHITGSTTGDNGFDATGTGNPSMFRFNNASSGSGAQDWSVIPGTDGTNTLKAGRAYRTFIRGDRSIDLNIVEPPATNTTLKARGELRLGTVDYAATVDNMATAPADFSFVANPYQAIVNYTDVTKTNLTDIFYVYDASINTRGAYVSIDISDPSNVFNNSSGASDANEFLVPGQAFFVQNNANGNGNLLFEENDKATSENPVTVFNTNTDFVITSSLYKTEDLQNGYGKADACMLRFNSAYNNIADYEDALKLKNLDENYAIINNGLRSIDKQSMPDIGHQIALYISNYRTNNYSLTFNFQNKPDGLGIILNDNYMNIQLELSNAAAYNFSVDETIPESIVEDRFSLVFDYNTLSTADNEFGHSFSLYPNPTQNGKFYIKMPALSGTAHITLTNVLGQQVYAQELDIQNQKVQVNADELSSGVYMLNLSQGDQSFSTKVILE